MTSTRAFSGISRRLLLSTLVVLPNLAGALRPTSAQAQGDPLPSWNEGPVKSSITTFVSRVTTQGGPDFVPPDQRIATFDNDGTLWVEQPMYVQLAFALDRVKAMAPMHPEWKDKQPFKAVLEGDMKALAESGERGLVELIMVTHAGMTTAEFAKIASDWLAATRDRRFNRPYTELVYQPMLELLAYLRASGFKTFIVSGGGVEFMRPWTERIYGIPPEQVVGSSIKTRFEMRDGQPVLFRLPAVNFIDDKTGKPVGINEHIGRRPIAAFGNSDGDLEMLQWTTLSGGVRLGLIVHHTDAEREYAYDRQSHFGKLDKALDAAAANRWTVVDMKRDWKKNLSRFSSRQEPSGAQVMLIILTIYVVLMWLVFAKLKLVRWGWISGTLAVLGGAFILAVFLAMFNYLTPSGSFVVVSRVIEVTPNVSGQVTAIPVKPNEPVKAGAVLFRIDPTPFRFKVSQLEAALAQARQQVKQLKASYEQASANVDGLTKQNDFNTQRLADMRKLTIEQAMSLFREQDTQVQYETVYAQLQAAKAAQEVAKLAMDSEIGGVNTAVAQIEAQLLHAKWELDQTMIVAPGDGYVSTMTLTVGDRALQARSVMSFIVSDEVTIVGMFSPNGFHTIRPDAKVKLVFDNDPGRIHDARIVTIPEGIGQGQVAVSGVLARAGSVGGAKAYPAVISIPGSIERHKLRVGMPGSATVFADNAGVIGLLMSILVWISSYTAYL